MILDYCEKSVIELAVRRGLIGLSDVRGCCRCGEDRARWILLRLTKQEYLFPAESGGFKPTRKAHIEVNSI